MQVATALRCITATHFDKAEMERNVNKVRDAT